MCHVVCAPALGVRTRHGSQDVNVRKCAPVLSSVLALWVLQHLHFCLATRRSLPNTGSQPPRSFAEGGSHLQWRGGVPGLGGCDLAALQQIWETTNLTPSLPPSGNMWMYHVVLVVIFEDTLSHATPKKKRLASAQFQPCGVNTTTASPAGGGGGAACW